MIAIGTFEEIFDIMFGPPQHDGHVRRWRSERYIAPRISDFDARMAEMMAEGRRLA